MHEPPAPTGVGYGREVSPRMTSGQVGKGATPRRGRGIDSIE